MRGTGTKDPFARTAAAAAQVDATQALADAAAAQGDATQALGDAAAAQGDVNALMPDATLPAKLSGARSAGVSEPAARVDHQHGSAIVGVTDGSSPASGDIGETLSSVVPLGSALALVTNTGRNVTGITLPAGNWEVTGFVGFAPTAGAISSREAGSLSTTSDVIDTSTGGFYQNHNAFTSTGALEIRPLSPRTFRVVANTPVYLVALSVFTTQPCSAFGTISARRIP